MRVVYIYIYILYVYIYTQHAVFAASCEAFTAAKNMYIILVQECYYALAAAKNIYIHTSEGRVALASVRGDAVT